jgi:hypothetical protein
MFLSLSCMCMYGSVFSLSDSIFLALMGESHYSMTLMCRLCFNSVKVTPFRFHQPNKK